MIIIFSSLRVQVHLNSNREKRKEVDHTYAHTRQKIAWKNRNDYIMANSSAAVVSSQAR